MTSMASLQIARNPNLNHQKKLDIRYVCVLGFLAFILRNASDR